MRRMLSPNVSTYKLRARSIVDATYSIRLLQLLQWLRDFDGHQVGWGPNSCDRVSGYVNFN